jgi:hypothetical protein
MSSHTVSVWKWANPSSTSTDYSKVSGTVTIQCCDYLWPVVEQIFKEIYNDSSQPVIMSAGGYNIRSMNNNSSSSVTSTHSYGGTIDINYNAFGGNVTWNWNNDNGSSSQPYPRSKEAWQSLPDNQYKYTCLYEGCTIVTIFEKYGFKWGGNFSQNYCDPMHFSVFNS